MSNNISLGLKKNWHQFSILVIINAFVGGMVGIERSILPKLAETSFGITTATATLSFIAAFGLSKALTNYYTGVLANRFGRKNLLVLGWLIALPIPFLIIYAPNWNWVTIANILLGINQGLTWSSTVMMKIDLVGEKDRGLAMGLNEFAGYLAVGLFAFLSAYVADVYGITPYPFYLGVVVSIIGLMLSIILVKDTRVFVETEHKNIKMIHPRASNNVFMDTTFKDKTLSAVTQAGLVNNLNDGMIWGLLPLLLASWHYEVAEIGLITAIYPTIWGFGQLFTGRLSDIYSKKSMLFWGMLIQGIAIILIPITSHFRFLFMLSSILGIGTALVYPTFLSAIAQGTNPKQRAERIGVFRFWRDMGYVVGAVLTGIIADVLGLKQAIIFVGLVTVLSSLIIHIRMREI